MGSSERFVNAWAVSMLSRCESDPFDRYHVIKEWISYGKVRLLGRSITPDEAREVRDMARRITAIILLELELDANYAAIKADAYAWVAKK